MPGAPKLFLREAFATLHPISFGRFKFPPPQKRSPGFNTFFPTPHLPDYPFSPRPPEAGGGNWGGKGAALRRPLFPEARKEAGDFGGQISDPPFSQTPPFAPTPHLPDYPFFPRSPEADGGNWGGGKRGSLLKSRRPPRRRYSLSLFPKNRRAKSKKVFSKKQSSRSKAGLETKTPQFSRCSCFIFHFMRQLRLASSFLTTAPAAAFVLF